MTQRLFSASAARIAGQVATVGFLLGMLLQLLLALGALPISMAWGGSQAALTPGLRLASLAAVAVLGGCALIIRRRAGLSGGAPASRLVKILAWVITIYMVLNTLGNFASASGGEAALFGPLSLVLALACFVVAAARSGA